jgi:phosphomannomutase
LNNVPNIPWTFVTKEFHREENRTATIKFVNTSMHGVSHPFVTRAFQQFGLAPFTPVQEQQDPDPEFPTVTFPNPEEKGSLFKYLLAFYMLNPFQGLW